VANTPWAPSRPPWATDHVFVGAEFTRINGQPQPGFASSPAAAPAADDEIDGVVHDDDEALSLFPAEGTPRPGSAI